MRGTILVHCASLAALARGLHVGHASGGAGGQRDLAFVHVPMNFGNSIALTAAVGSGSKLEYQNVTKAAAGGWEAVTPLVRPGAPVWGPLNPDLQATSEYGYPMYYTPQKHWPKDLAGRYFGNRTVFGLLRDPYERLVAYFRAGVAGVARAWDFTPDGRVCAGELSEFAKSHLRPALASPASRPDVNVHRQADFFDGEYGITHPLDLDSFPASANSFLREHGYDTTIGVNDMIHVVGCDNTWAGHFDKEARHMIKEYYSRDFELRCSHFGHCDHKPDHCLKHVPGMCPGQVFRWDRAEQLYKLKE
mmetsp:Transcript_20023/g.56311  ORF Transcript_20023/g.56311 Transcript_20023/m.56311 type:complete len:305 (-) Transcript_20023:6-920(-)